MPRQIQHPSHPQHPLTLCIHQYGDRSWFICDLCNKLCENVFCYYCYLCDFNIDITCEKFGEDNNYLFQYQRTEKEEDDDSDHAIQLPISLSDFSKEVITPFIIRNGGSIINVDDMTSVTMPATNLNFSMLFNYHKHPLSLTKADDDDNNGKNEMIKICDLCITPILSPPYYSCADCKYFVHLTCYFLPKTIRDDDPLHEYNPRRCQNHKLTLYGTSSKDICCKSTNGIAYCCQSCHVTIDVKCASLPAIIKHASHRNHKLIKREIRWQIRPCVVCDNSVYSQIAYYCSNVNCEDFWIHIGCAMLPPSIKHRWDKHPLLLTFDASIDHPNDFYCEACENEMHPKRGMYHCRECDQSFHTRCLTESGRHGNIKFGRQLEFGDLHPHPLTYNIVSLKYKCDRCGRVAYKERGFECANSNCNCALCEYCGLDYLYYERLL
ncbi:hypothetical protein CDL12_22876 [Handroanthus impetiginosus]|uniref:Zinc finger PHD-type domain-containing protein n=1 Tax=Handroanthus impetiginosus TaxID=429701 RepID=A0A2G9GH32_9LAMI|nr:hypothetical protein CDL12_22876 [Handroanthus impetiginosus]